MPKLTFVGLLPFKSFLSQRNAISVAVKSAVENLIDYYGFGEEEHEGERLCPFDSEDDCTNAAAKYITDEYPDVYYRSKEQGRRSRSLTSAQSQAQLCRSKVRSK